MIGQRASSDKMIILGLTLLTIVIIFVCVYWLKGFVRGLLFSS
jgi:hypothetical protein